MHLILLNQYYPPDAAPTGVMLHAVAERLVADGHEVTVICAAGGYAGKREKTWVDGGSGMGDEEMQEMKMGQDAPATAWGETPQPLAQAPDSRGVRILRLPASRFGRGSFLGKLADYGSYYIGVAWTLATLQPRPQRVIALTTPPYLSLLARVFSKIRGGDHAHWVMDVYPDVMVAHGMLRQAGAGQRALAGLARLGYGGKRCAAVVTLGPDMAERVASYSVGKVEWVPLWGSGSRSGGGEAAAAAALALRRQRGWGDAEMVVMYSGNMGLGHRFGEILQVAARLAAEPARLGVRVRFAFHGGGKRCGEIEDFIARCPEGRVERRGYAAAGELAAHLAAADLHLVSLAPEWTGTMLPSKLQGIFEAGRAVIFVGDARSSLGRWVEESGGGWVAPAGDPERLFECLAEAVDPAERRARAARAADFSRRVFNREINARRLAECFAGPGTR